MLTGRSNLDFVHRSFAAGSSSPSRDVGVMVHGRLHRGDLEYEAGYFARDGDNARTKQTRGAGNTLAARKIGRASCRERVQVRVGGVSFELKAGLSSLYRRLAC